MIKVTAKSTERGITIVSLVVTIILLLILSGISIQGITHTGIFDSTKKAKLEAKRAQIEEWLSLKVIEEQNNYPRGKADKIIPIVREDVIENISELQNIGKVEEKDITETSTEENLQTVDTYFYVTVDEDVYKVDLNEQKFIGEVGKLPPAIRLDNISSDTSTITVKVSTQNNQGGKIEYYIKSEEESSYVKKDTLDSETSQEYTYKNLTQNKKYSIKVVAISKNKQTSQVFGDAATGNVTGLEIKVNTTNWSTSQTITITAVDSNYSNIRYTTDGTIPTSTTGTTIASGGTCTITSNCTITAVAFDSTGQAGSASTNTVTKIDTVEPVIEAIKSAVSSTISTEAKLSTTVNDANSGLSKIVWQWGTTTSFGSSKTDTYTEMNGSTTGTKESVTATCELKGLSAGTKYYARVIVYDVAGNPNTSSTIEFTTGAGVAQVGDTIYTSLQNAITATTTGTVKMLSNTTISTTVTIASDKNITLNLNGKTIAGASKVVTIRNAGKLTVTGTGTISQINADAIYNDTTGTVVFNSGTLKGTSGWTVLNGGNFNFNGGSIQHGGSSNGTAIMNTKKFTISGGSITSSEYGVVDRGSDAIFTASNATIQTTGNKYNALHHEAGKATIVNCTVKATQSTSNAIANNTSNYTDVIIKSRASNYGISGLIFGKVLATTNTSKGQAQENITIYNTGYTSLFWPTWTSKAVNGNAQDDLTWDITTNSSGTHTYTVKKSAHNNETGAYNVHIYVNNNGVANPIIANIGLTF